MKNIKIFALMAFSTISYAAQNTGEKRDEDESSHEIVKVMETKKEEVKEKERGIDRMNFYIPVKEKNKYSSFSEVNVEKDKSVYQWTLAEGYADINRSWDFNYKIEREYHREKSAPSSYIWENEISLVRLNRGFKLGNQAWNYRSLAGIKQSETKSGDFLKNSYYKFYVGQRFSSYIANLGMGGTYGEFEITLNGVKGKERDGYSILSVVKASSNLGYGFQVSGVLENEYMNYNKYKGDFRSKFEGVFKWTYELGKNIAFSPEVNVKAEKYFSSEEGSYTFEATAAPYIHYSVNMSEKVRLYGKAGPVYKFSQSRYGELKNSRSYLEGYAKVGIEYIF